MGLRNKFYHAAENFDRQIDERIKRLPSWVKSALLFAMGFFVGFIDGEAKPRNRVAVTLGLLGLGFAVAFSVLVFTRQKGKGRK